jgi:hypothetical protein
MKLYRLLHKQCMATDELLLNPKTKNQKGLGDLARKQEKS